MFRKVKHFKKDQEGAAILEFAFVFPIFILFLIGLFELCRALFTINTMQLAIDSAGRYAMLNIAASDAQIVSTAQANLYGVNSNNFTITSASQVTGGVTYKVITASFVFNFIAPGVLPNGGFTLTRSTTVPLMP